MEWGSTSLAKGSARKCRLADANLPVATVTVCPMTQLAQWAAVCVTFQTYMAKLPANTIHICLLVMHMWPWWGGGIVWLNNRLHKLKFHPCFQEEFKEGQSQRNQGICHVWTGMASARKISKCSSSRLMSTYLSMTAPWWRQPLPLSYAATCGLPQPSVKECGGAYLASPQCQSLC